MGDMYYKDLFSGTADPVVAELDKIVDAIKQIEKQSIAAAEAIKKSLAGYTGGALEQALKDLGDLKDLQEKLKKQNEALLNSKEKLTKAEKEAAAAQKEAEKNQKYLASLRDNYFKEEQKRIDSLEKQKRAALEKELKETKLAIEKAEALREKEAIKAAKEAEKQTNLKLKALNAQAKAEATARESLEKQRSAAYQKMFADQQKAAAAAKKEADAIRQQTELLSREARSIAELQKQNNLLMKQRREMVVITKEDEKARAQLTKVIEQNQNRLKAFDAEIGNYQRNVGNYSSAVKGFGQNILGLVGIGGVSMILADAGQKVIEFDKKIKTLESLNIELPKSQIKELADEAKRLGASTEYTSSQVADLMIEYSKAGFSKNEIMQVTEATLNLATATGSDLARASEIAASNLRAFQKPASEMGQMIDIMGAAFNKSALGLEDWAYATKYVAPVAKAANMSFEQMAAMLSVLTDAGIKGETAGTGLRRIITEIGASGKPTAQALKDLAEKGLTLADANDEVGKTAMTQLLVLGKNLDKVQQLTVAYENANGAMLNSANVIRQSLSVQIDLAKSSWEGFVLSLNKSGVISNFLSDIVKEFENTFMYLRGLNEGKIGFWEFLFGDDKEVAKKVNAQKKILRLSDFQISEFEKRRVEIAKGAAQMSGEARERELARILSINKQIEAEYKLRKQDALEREKAKQRADSEALDAEKAKNNAAKAEREKAAKASAKAAKASAKAAKEAAAAKEKEFQDSLKIEKLLADAMLDGQEKDLELLRISFEEKKHEFEKYGLDTTLLQDSYLSEQSQILDKYLEKQIDATHEANKKLYDSDLSIFKNQQELAEKEFSLKKRTKQEKYLFSVNQEIALYEKELELAQKYPGLIGETELNAIKKNLDNAKNALNAIPPMNFLERVLGLEEGDGVKMWDAIKATWKAGTDALNDMVQGAVDKANRLVEARKKAVEESQATVDKERELAAQGVANNYESALKDLENKKKLQAEAIKEQEKAQKRQQAIDTATQLSNMITAGANIWKEATKLGPWGYVLAGIQTIAMLASFVAMKRKAKEATSTQYGRGGVIEIGGGTHASGDDTTLYYDKKRNHSHKVERGELVSVYSATASQRYGNVIRSFTNAINGGTFKAVQMPQVAPETIDYTRFFAALVQNTTAKKESNVTTQTHVIGNKLVEIRMQNGVVVSRNFIEIPK